MLDEPVPRLSRADTLPWDCSMSDAAVLTLIPGGMAGEGHVHHVLSPLVVRATLAAQQEGVAMTLHSDTVELALSRKQVNSW